VPRARGDRGATDWLQIVALYDALTQVAPSPVVELNRAVAVGMAFGPAAGLELVDALVDDPALGGYHLLPSVRGDLLAKLGATPRPSRIQRAAGMTRNARERELLLARAAEASAAAGGHAPLTGAAGSVARPARALRQSRAAARQEQHDRRAREHQREAGRLGHRRDRHHREVAAVRSDAGAVGAGEGQRVQPGTERDAAAGKRPHLDRSPSSIENAKGSLGPLSATDAKSRSLVAVDHRRHAAVG
jgi:hypothetical protein